MGKRIRLADITKELKIDVPVMAARVVGKNIELFLYGGDVVTYPLPVKGEVDEVGFGMDLVEEEDEVGQDAAQDYGKLKVKELRSMAKERGVLGYDAMRKIDLIEALERRDVWPEG